MADRGRFGLFFQGSRIRLGRVKKVSKAILIGLGVLLVLVALLLVGLNIHIQRPQTQARIQEELSKSLRVPLKLTNVSVSPWNDLRITGLSIPNGAGNLLEATSFEAHFRWLPLFTGRLVISDMVVDTPKLVLIQDEKGKWQLPEPEKAAEVSKAEAKAEGKDPGKEPATPKSTAEASPEKSEKPEKPEKKAARKQPVTVEHFEIRSGTVELWDSHHKHVAVFADVNASSTALDAAHVEGTAEIGKAIWADGLALENVRTPFKYSEEEISIPEITATFAGGTLRGVYLGKTNDDGMVYKVAVTLAQIDVDRLMVQLGGQAGQAHGELGGQIEVHGDTRRPDKLDGVGRLDLRNGQFSQLELFQNIGQVLGLRQLSDLRLKDGHTDLRLASDKVYVDKLLLSTPDLQLTAKGMVRLDQRINLDAQLSIEDSLVKQLPPMVRDSFSTVTADNRRAIDFNVTGSTDKLKTNLLDKLIGQKINVQFGDLLGSLFGGGDDRKSADDPKKKEEEERRKAEKKAEKERKKNKDKDKAGKTPDATPAPATTPAPPAASTPAAPSANLPNQ